MLVLQRKLGTASQNGQGLQFVLRKDLPAGTTFDVYLGTKNGQYTQLLIRAPRELLALRPEIQDEPPAPPPSPSKSPEQVEARRALKRRRKRSVGAQERAKPLNRERRVALQKAVVLRKDREASE